MIMDQDVFPLRNNVLAMLYRSLYEVLFQGHFANYNTYSLGGFVPVHGEK